MAHFADERVPGIEPRAVGRVDRDPRVVGVLRPARRSARAGSGSATTRSSRWATSQGKTLLHLQCHFGIDTLSWARLGATVTGADFSPKAIELATSLAADLDLDARFVESNVYDLPERLEGSFDVVYTSRGVLGWLPDIRGWARVVAHFVKPGGIFFITEAHPIAWALDDDDCRSRSGTPIGSTPSPIASDVEGSYADVSADVRSEKEYSWQHGLGEIVTALDRRRPDDRAPPRVSVLGVGHGVDRGGPGRHLGEAGLRGRRAPAVLLAPRSEARLAIDDRVPLRRRSLRAVVPTGGRRSRGS